MRLLAMFVLFVGAGNTNESVTVPERDVYQVTQEISDSYSRMTRDLREIQNDLKELRRQR
jgi:nitrogen fixation/metabolism regulation signal transduction histidine kinase